MNRLNRKNGENKSMKVLSKAEYKKYFYYFYDEERFYITKYFKDTVSKVLKENFDLKYYDKGRWWYSDWNCHKRMVITLFASKGITYPMIWGYNYDFIPRLNNQNKFIWHRTQKSFHLDIEDAYYNYVPVIPKRKRTEEHFFNPEQNAKYQYELPIWTNDLEFALKYIEDVVKRNIPFMLDWYQRVQTIEDVIGELDKQIAISSQYGHWNEYYTKAFLLAKIKCMDEALETMGQIYRNEIPPKIMEKLYQTSQLE